MPTRNLEIRRDSDEPVYEQIARTIRELIAARRLVPGEPLPSVRALASDLGVNLNTVARAYRLLEVEGFLAIEDRRGVLVAAPRRARPKGSEDLAVELRGILVRMRQAGWTPNRLLGLAKKEIARLEDARGANGGTQ
jgi:DNA-binding transcriptional regulator YhcF (GntR family)